MGFQLYFDEEISGWASNSCVPFLRCSQITCIVHSLGNCNAFSGSSVNGTLALTCETRIANERTNSVAHAAHLLNSKRTLTQCLEATATTSSTSCRLCSWLWFTSIAGVANWSALKLNGFWCARDSFHKVNLNRELLKINDHTLTVMSFPFTF